MFYPMRVVFVRWKFESRSKLYLCINATYVLYMCEIWTCIDLCCSLSYNCARMFFYMSITYCVVHVFTCAVIASAAVPHLGPAVPLYGSAMANEWQCRTKLSQLSCCAWTVICITVIYLVEVKFFDFSKNKNWKCNQALIVGFGDNNHAIRELMRFIEMTSREFIFEDTTRIKRVTFPKKSRELHEVITTFFNS